MSDLWEFFAKRAYLAALGYDDAAIVGMMSTTSPNAKDLADMQARHIRKIPFNNMGMHPHPAAGPYPAVPAKPPTLDVPTAVNKIVSGHGGFCFEINLGFSWLLRGLGYKVRLIEGSVITPGGPVPGHLCLLVDGIDPGGAVLVDPGIGDFSRMPVPMSLKASGGSITDELGDVYTLKPTTDYATPWCSRFNTVLMKERPYGLMSNPTCEPLEIPDMPIEPMPPAPKYVFADGDDLATDGPELSFGIGAVLTVMPENFFSQKKFAVKCTDKGFIYLGAKYTKEKAHGAQISRTDFEDEAAFRKAAVAFGVTI